MISACESVIARLPADVKVIPGHGELSNLAEVGEYLQMLQGTTAVVAKALAAGKTLAQMQQHHVLAAWAQKYSGEFINTDTFIESLYNSLTYNTHAPFVKHN